jgi:hypothetical protein
VEGQDLAKRVEGLFAALRHPEPAAGADEDTEEVEVQLEVKEGEEVNDLSYEATLVEQD